MADPAEIHVSTASELTAALRSAKGGETIVLADGDYGTVALRGSYWVNLNKYDTPVTITSANPGGAVFDVLTVESGVNLTFDQLTIKGGFSVYNSQNIALTNSTGYGLLFRDSDGVTVSGNHISGATNTLNLWSVANFTITDNVFENARSDLIQISRNSYNGLIENNILRDVVATDPSVHPDMIQIFGWDGMSPHDITIRGNYLYDDPATGLVPAQGIFLSPPSGEGFSNILIEENLISVRHPSTIFIAGGQENVVIQNNSLIAGPEVYKGGTILLSKQAGYDNSGVVVEGNIASGIILETTGGTLGENAFYGSWLNVLSVFQGYGAAWEDFIPLDGATYAGFGAEELLAAWRAALAEEPATEPVAGPEAEPGAENSPGGGMTDEASAEPEPVPVPEPVPEPEPEPEPEVVIPPAPRQVASMHNLDLAGALNANAWKSVTDVISHIAHNEAHELAEGTVAFSFTADTIAWRRGLFSKDSKGLDNGLTAWFDSGTLKVTFEDETGIRTVTHKGLKANETYDLQISFGEGMGRVWLDGALIGEVETGMDWRENGSAITLGADNSQSAEDGIAAIRSAFDGRLTDFAIYDHAMTPEELAELRAGRSGDPVLLEAGESPAEIAGYRDLYLQGNLNLPAKWNNGNNAVSHIAHDETVETGEGTVALTFNAASVDWRRGIMSKDAAGIDHGLAVWINSGTLNIAFEDGEVANYISHTGLKANVDYDLQITFGEGMGRVWLDGALIGEVETGMDWRENGAAITLGADNSLSAEGGIEAIRSAFAGNIRDFTVYDHAMTPAELQAWLEADQAVLV